MLFSSAVSLLLLLLLLFFNLWISFLQSTIPISISRVNQVDAARLDVEMSAMLKEQLVKVFSLMKVYLVTYCNIHYVIGNTSIVLI